MTRATKTLATSLRRFGKTAEFEVTGWGFTQREIEAAIVAGAVVRVGNHMGATTIRYLSAR